MNELSPTTAKKLRADGSQPVPLLVYGKLVLVALFWGGTFPAIRIVSQTLPDLQIIPAAFRCAIAVMLLLVVARKLEGGLPRLSATQFGVTVALGCTGFFLNVISMFAAMTYIPAGRAALIVALNPVLTALALALFFRERLGALKWGGIALAFVGAAVIITRGELGHALSHISESVGMGELLMFGAISCWVAYALIGQHALKGLSPVAATTYAALWGTLLLSVGSIFEWPALDISLITWQVVAALIYLGAFGTVIGFVWYYEGIIAIGPSRTAIFNNLVPVFGIALSAVFLQEPVLMSMIVGGLLVVAGVSLTNS